MAPSRPSVVATYFVAVATTVVVVAEPQALHWFLLPCGLCGLLWTSRFLAARKRAVSPFDPDTWLAAFCIHLFFLAPLLHLLFDYYGAPYAAPPDWRPWFGRMALWNLALSLVVLGIAGTGDRRSGRRLQPPPLSDARGNAERAVAVARASSYISGFAFVVLVLVSGGPLEYLRVSSTRLEAFGGLGWLVLVADLLPICLALELALRERFCLPRLRLGVVTALVLICTLQVLMGGLRGSRVQVVMTGFVVLGLLSWSGRRLRSRTLVSFAILALLFAYLYGFYKTLGTDVFGRLREGASLEELEGESRRGVDVLLLGDLGRSDIQAAILFQLSEGRPDFERRHGSTYLHDLIINVPTRLRPQLDETGSKVAAGTELLLGQLPEGFRVGNIYGLSGEAMLNFGAVGILPMAAVYALISRRVLVRFRRAPNGSAVLLLAPSVTLVLLMGLMSDLDQVVYVVLRFWLVPYVVYRALGAGKSEQLVVDEGAAVGVST